MATERRLEDEVVASVFIAFATMISSLVSSDVNENRGGAVAVAVAAAREEPTATIRSLGQFLVSCQSERALRALLSCLTSQIELTSSSRRRVALLEVIHVAVMFAASTEIHGRALWTAGAASRRAGAGYDGGGGDAPFDAGEVLRGAVVEVAALIQAMDASEVEESRDVIGRDETGRVGAGPVAGSEATWRMLQMADAWDVVDAFGTGRRTYHVVKSVREALKEAPRPLLAPVSRSERSAPSSRV